MPRLDALARSLDGALIATDFDGTLAPIVSDPLQARPVHGVVEVLAQLTMRGAQVAVVTGRECEVVLELGELDLIPGIVIHVLHGAQKWVDGTITSVPAPPGLAVVRDELPKLTTPWDGVWIEDKHLGLVVHTRVAADPSAAFRALLPSVTDLASTNGLEVHRGKEVLEIRLPHVSKADSLRELLTPATTAALFAGDDLGDLSAMQAVHHWGRHMRRPALTVAVGDVSLLRDTAELHVDRPADLAELLRGLLG